MDLFSEINKTKKLPLPGANITYYPSFISSEKASEYFQELLEETPWQQDDIKVFGKVYKQPRLTALFGDKEKSYTYSGITMHPKPFTPLLLEIKTLVEATSNSSFTTVLLNLYRDGDDSNGWHSDDEKELGENPVIASVSLGVKRIFHLRHKKDEKIRYSIALNHGSLLLMQDETQHNWQHQLPKSKKIHDPRINLTFRVIS